MGLKITGQWNRNSARTSSQKLLHHGLDGSSAASAVKLVPTFMSDEYWLPYVQNIKSSRVSVRNYWVHNPKTLKPEALNPKTQTLKLTSPKALKP